MRLPGTVPWPQERAAAYRTAGYWSGQTLFTIIERHLDAHGDAIALVDRTGRTTYAELHSQALSLAAGFAAQGLRPGERVVVQLPNRRSALVTSFALYALGALPIYALPAHREAEIGYFCTHSEAVAYIVPGAGGFDYQGLARKVQAHAPTLRHIWIDATYDQNHYPTLESLMAPEIALPRPEASDEALFQLSGGSTGVPKLIARTHDDYLYSIRTSAEICGLDATSAYLCALPYCHNFALSSPGVLGTLWAGGKVILAEQPTPEAAFPLLAAEKATITALVPPLARLWLDAKANRPDDLSSLKVLQIGGAPLEPSLARRLGPAFGCTLQQVYGMAEGLVNYTRLDDSEELITATQGRPMSPADELRVVDASGQVVAPGEVGELQTRGPYTICGYFAAPEHNQRAFTHDGFYCTGDLVRQLASGHLIVVGRVKDQINRGGEKIAATELEAYLLGHPAIKEAALIGLPDTHLGERSCAVIVAAGPAPTRADLVAYLRGRGIAAYKIPDRIVTVEALPKTAVGKIDKRALRETLSPKQEETPWLSPA